MYQRVTALFIFFLLLQKLAAQPPDSVLMLPAVEIQADKVSSFAAGIKIEKIDSTVLTLRQSENLASLISENSGATLRSYGPGGIGLLTMRGTSAVHSAVFWNGINLNQPNIGMTDLSRIPVFLFSDLQMQSGGASALLGSGVIGGCLLLGSRNRFSEPGQAAVLLSAGSAGQASAGFKISTSGSSIAYTGGVSGQYNRNDFRYTQFDGSRTRLSHGLVKQLATVHQLDFKLNKRQSLSTGLWYEACERQIPPTMVMASSDQVQFDRTLRTFVKWLYADEKQAVTLNAAYVGEKEHFRSEVSSIDALYHISQTTVSGEYRRTLYRLFTLRSELSGKVLSADNPYYQGVMVQKEGAVSGALAYRSRSEKVQSVLNLRQEITAGYRVPFCPSLSAEMLLLPQVKGRLAVSRNFRIPTLNDRFWIPGGNPTLKPENSWNQETGITVLAQKAVKKPVEIDASFYNMLIGNMILWVPGNSGLWAPENVQKVWSRGAEFKLNLIVSSNKTSTKLLTSYNFNRSTYEATNTATDLLKGKQLIYFPVHKGLVQLQMNRRPFFAMVSVPLSGKRYTVNDNSQSLAAYGTMNLDFGAAAVSGNTNLQIKLQVRNIFNKEYQSVLYYPEPGRSFMLTIEIKAINKHNDKLNNEK